MQNVPKIVHQRLKASPPDVNHPSADHPPANHPDANVLTAFAERTLREDERAIVLEHLSRCGECRDVLALALPATELAQTAMRPPAREWLTWPAMRWGFAAAGVVAVAALGFVQHQRQVERAASKSPARFEIATKEAENQPLASPTLTADAKKADHLQPPTAARAYSVQATNGTRHEVPRRSHAELLPAPVPPHGSVGQAAGQVGVRLGGPVLANQWQQQNAIQNQASAPAASSPFAKQQAAGDLTANAPAPAVSETAVESQSTRLDTLTQNPKAGQSKDEPVQPPQANQDYVLARVGKAKPAEAAASARAPRWTINSTGGLQRSFDQGASWQVVDVNASPAYFTDATSIQINGKTSRAKARKMASPIFRAVVATGIDVWAGGSGGALYHSLDAGDHWVSVMPSSSGTILTGDVVSLEFPDTQHGKVSTSTAEVWTTSDAGQTWQRQ